MNTLLKPFATPLPVFLESSDASGITALAEILSVLKLRGRSLQTLLAVHGSEVASQLEKDVP